MIDNRVQDSYFIFTFVRNPWERALSEYKWRLRIDDYFSFFLLPSRNYRNIYIQKLRKYFYIPKVSFKKFLLLQEDQVFKNKSIRYKNEWFQHNRLQYDYIFDDNNKLLVDFIGRIENIDTDWSIIAEKIGINKKLPYRNVSNSGDYKKYYNNETKSLVAKRYKKDIDFFGYKFRQNA